MLFRHRSLAIALEDKHRAVWRTQTRGRGQSRDMANEEQGARFSDRMHQLIIIRDVDMLDVLLCKSLIAEPWGPELVGRTMWGICMMTSQRNNSIHSMILLFKD